MVHADLGDFFELFVLGQNPETDNGNTKTVSPMCQPHLSCSGSYLLE